ncbi:DUF4142 domain-containing protein [Sphingomonas sp. HF-S3]|uniref:DUF4142 domain-containing protein n=1 Tax=Sphingomonas rustica TaxID=3103142 RepID=A0ABV0BCB6_9SPHN
MNRTTLFTLTLPAFALLAACNGNTDADTSVTNNGAAVTEISSTTENGTMNTTIATPAMTPQQFADTAAASDMFEIESGKLAQQKSSTQALKDFGKMMVDHHTRSTEALKTAAGKASPALTPVAKLDAEQTANLEALRGATGAEFDRLYRDQQTAAHQKALAAMQAYGETGDSATLKDFASSTQSVVKSHLERLQAM